MAVRFKPFAHWSPKWGAAATGAGVAGLAALAFAGEGQAILTVLAAGGAASGALFAAGKLHLSWEESRIDARLQQVLGALPSAVAVTSRKGKVLWRSEAFHKLLGCSEGSKDLSRLGEGQPEAAAAVFRLFSAACGGASQEETITLPQIAGGAPVQLKVAPHPDRGSRSEYLIWQIEEAKAAAGAESWGSAIAGLPVPALSIAKDLSVQAASAAFEQLFGSSPVGAQAWTLFRTRRGKPFTRAWLRDVIAKADEPTAVQIVGANGATRAALPSLRRRWRSLPLPGNARGGGRKPGRVVRGAARARAAADGAHKPKGRHPGGKRCLPRAFPGERRRVEREPPSFAANRWRCWSRTHPRKMSATGSRALASRVALETVPSSCKQRSKAALAGASALSCFPAANGSNLIVTAIESGAAALGGEDAVQSQKLQAVGELAGGIAHDFNNLLTAIIGHSDLLLRRFRASDSAFKDVMNIKGSATRAAELVKQILAYSRRQTLRPADPEAHRRHRGIPGHHGPHARRKGQGHRPAWPRSVVREGRRGPDFPGNHEPRGERARRHAGRRRDRDQNRECERARVAGPEGPRA